MACVKIQFYQSSRGRCRERRSPDLATLPLVCSVIARRTRSLLLAVLWGGRIENRAHKNLTVLYRGSDADAFSVSAGVPRVDSFCHITTTVVVSSSSFE